MGVIRPALQFSEGRSRPWSGAKLVNCFAEKSDGDKESEFSVMLIPGTDLFETVGTGPIRGTNTLANLLYVVSGNTLWSVSAIGETVELGTIPGTGPVVMANNGDEIAISAPPNGYVYGAGAIVAPTNLPQVSDVAYIDGYFVWSIFDSDQCIYSGINDGMSYDLLDIFTAEGSPDGLKGLINDHRELQLYGTDTIEVWYNSGGADNAFERQGNAFIERGCFDRDSIAKIDNSVHFVGDDRIIYRLDGYTPLRISTHAIEYQLRNATYYRAFVYTQEGHKFYILNTDVGSFGFDLATGTWHKRQSWNMVGYRIGGAIKAWDRTLLTDAFTGNLYFPSLDTYTENGEIIALEIELPTIGDGQKRLICYSFQVYCETGVGLVTGQGADPQIMLQYSKDGGRNYSMELWRSLGAIGNYLTRAIWRNLGQFWQLDIRIRITDPIRRLVISYFADVR